MKKFDRQFTQEMKQKLDLDLLGVARIEDLAPEAVKNSAESLLPGAASAVVFGKEIYKEIGNVQKLRHHDVTDAI